MKYDIKKSDLESKKKREVWAKQKKFIIKQMNSSHNLDADISTTKGLEDFTKIFYGNIEEKLEAMKHNIVDSIKKDIEKDHKGAYKVLTEEDEKGNITIYPSDEKKAIELEFGENIPAWRKAYTKNV